MPSRANLPTSFWMSATLKIRRDIRQCNVKSSLTWSRYFLGDRNCEFIRINSKSQNSLDWADHKLFPFFDRKGTLTYFDVCSTAHNKNCFDSCSEQSQDIELAICRTHYVINVDVCLETSIELRNTVIQRSCNCPGEIINVHSILIFPFEHVEKVFMSRDQVRSRGVLND